MDQVREYVRTYDFEFPEAVDADWGALRTLWLDRVPDADSTSATLLVDRHGILRHVQKGGAYAKDAPDPRARDDYRSMWEAIIELVAEP